MFSDRLFESFSYLKTGLTEEAGCGLTSLTSLEGGDCLEWLLEFPSSPESENVSDPLPVVLPGEDLCCIIL